VISQSVYKYKTGARPVVLPLPDRVTECHADGFSAYEARNRTERPHHTSKASHPMRRDWRPRIRLEVEFGLKFGAPQERSDEQTDQWGRTADTSRKNQKAWVGGPDWQLKHASAAKTEVINRHISP